MRIAFVVQRYGLDVHGGAETHCRLWCERLAARHRVDVFTTCARDYLTWSDYYPAGMEVISDVRVQRFPVDAPRDLQAFDAYSQVIFDTPHTESQELDWMRQQGPYSSQLFRAIEAQRDNFDLFVFFTYLYCTTFFGLPLVREKAVLVPTAHDEPPLYLNIFRRLFAAPKYIILNTFAEQSLLRRHFNIAHIPSSLVGVGVDLLPIAPPEAEADPPELLYIGRVHGSKGCDKLYEFFVRYLAERGTSLRLVLAGRRDMDLPDHPQVVQLGYVSEDTKVRLLQRCALLILPSSFESLSIVCLEAWSAAKATLVNGRAVVLREQSLRSGGGLFYQNYDEFAACLDLLLPDRRLRVQLGQQGRSFVQHVYNWTIVEQRLEHSLDQALKHM